MKIELRNVKYAEFASEETRCFEATIYIDGERVGTARNAGHGGSTDIDPRALEERLDAYGATLPEVDLGEGLGERRMMKQDGEWIVESLLTEWLIARDLKRALAGKILFRAADGTIRETKRIPKDRLALLLGSPVQLQQQFKSTEILNLMPFERALEVYRSVQS